MTQPAVDILGGVLAVAGITVQLRGWTIVWTAGPQGFRWVAASGVLVAVGIALLAWSWLHDRHTGPGGAHRSAG